MGALMALNLALAGLGVRVWSRTPRKTAPLGDEVEVCEAASEAVSGAAAVVTMLSNGAAVESVMRDGGVLEPMEDSALWASDGLEVTERCSKAARRARHSVRRCSSR